MADTTVVRLDLAPVVAGFISLADAIERFTRSLIDLYDAYWPEWRIYEPPPGWAVGW